LVGRLGPSLALALGAGLLKNGLGTGKSGLVEKLMEALGLSDGTTTGGGQSFDVSDVPVEDIPAEDIPIEDIGYW